jgi:predicted metalloprotease with PDZ domain
MNLALFRYAAGRERLMNKRYALLLSRLHFGSVVEHDKEPPVKASPSQESMTVEELREKAAALGVKVHHRAGREKLLAALDAYGVAD